MQKHILLLLLTLSWALAGHSQENVTRWGDQRNGSYMNPILNADFSDPDIIRVDSTYYMVASDFHFIGMQVLRSYDMVNWEYVSQIYRRFDFPAWEKNGRYAGGSWAPAIRHHQGRFYVYFCTPDEGLFMATATKAEGPWSELHLVKAIEKWEDPCPFWDEDGQAYLCRSKHRAGPIIIHKMSNDGKQLLDEGRTVYTGPVAEGPKMYKRNGFYYISIPEGGVGEGWQTILRSRNIYGPYESRRVLEQGSTPINGPHQGAIVQSHTGEWWFYHFQHDGALGRVTHLQPMHWAEDWPVIGVDQDRNGVGEPVVMWSSPLPSRECRLQTSDHFDSPILALQWQWNHNPVDEAWSLTEHPGHLTLHALQSPDFRNARNTLTQKCMGYNSQATTDIDLRYMTEGQRCGLACMGKANHILGIRKENGRKELYLSNDTVEKQLCAWEGEDIRLRLDFNMKRSELTFSYSTDGRTFIPIDTVLPARFGHWKGVRPALFCYNTRQNTGQALFRHFDYHHDGPAPTTANEMEQIVRNIATTCFPDREITVEKRASTNDRQLLQAAIDSCSLIGGGRVTVKEGTYLLNGNLLLKSDVNLHLEAGATLLFSGVADDFLPVVQSRWEGTELYGHSPMIYALHAQNIAITGKGTIDAQGGKEFAAWAAKEAPDRDRLREMGEQLTPLHQRIFGKGTILRPSCIQFIGCSRILIQDVTIKNSPFWTIHPVYCDNVIVRGVTIDSHYPNNDGCDPESTSNVLIEHCTFRTGDDAIAIKSGRDNDGRNIGRPSKNIVIRHCLFRSECNGLCIGSEMSGGVENVFMHDIRIGTVKNAIYFKSNRDRGGYIRRVWVNDITVERAHGAILRFEANYFGYRGGNHATSYENFTIRNVEARQADNYALFMDGYEEKPITDILIEHFTVHQARQAHYLKCTEKICLKKVFVNGKELPEHPEEHKERVTLDIY
ncbi:MAG: family 43 glycosylhydrolase [Bacteroides sp.]|nr:family 43 glycosylhydrolase [Bacteroides sp.]